MVSVSTNGSWLYYLESLRMNGLEKFDLRTQIIKSLDACKRVIDDPDLSRLMREAKKLDACLLYTSPSPRD